ncbi:N-acetylglucosamine kinase [Pseudarthrobacter sp. NPDC057230]|uniref:N-acetylglucosamine kinase n=1 Tax=Micrococcaceae TaxID=1268 RepID=UPI0009E8AEEE
MGSSNPTIAIDAGQSSIRARLICNGRTQLERHLPPVLTDMPLMPQLERAVCETLSGLNLRNVRISAAMSGLTASNSDAQAVLRSCQAVGVVSVHLAHDSVSGYLGCLGSRQGSAIAAGTGVVTLATGANTCARVDGWGHIMGDAGSGYWIGRAGLDAAMRAYDGRGEETAILDLIKRDFSTIETTYIDIQSDIERVSLVASYARQIIELSERDAVAARIVDQAAGELVHSVGVSLRRTGWLPGSQPYVSWAGSILSNPLIGMPFRYQMGRAWPNALLVSPSGSALDGAAKLAELTTHHPLYQSLDVAALETMNV